MKHSLLEVFLFRNAFELLLHQGGCIELRLLGDFNFKILLKSPVIQSFMLKSYSKSSVI